MRDCIRLFKIGSWKNKKVIVSRFITSMKIIASMFFKKDIKYPFTCANYHIQDCSFNYHFLIEIKSN